MREGEGGRGKKEVRKEGSEGGRGREGGSKERKKVGR